MPTGSDHHSTSIVKLLILGDAKSGKTTALASLIAAGYHLHILDLDNLLDPLIGRIRTISPSNLDNLDYITVRDKYKPGLAGPILDGKPKAWPESVKLLNDWHWTNLDGTTTSFGHPNDWPDDHILVIDSLSRWCDAAYNYHESIMPVGKSGDYDGRAVYGNAQDAVETILAMLTADYSTFNLIVICHGVYMTLEDGTRIFPQGVGQKLSPKIPQYFPNYIRFVNAQGRRKIELTSSAMINLAFARPDAIPKEGLDTDTGLAKLFSILRQPGAHTPAKAPPAEETSASVTTLPGPTTALSRPPLLRRS